MGRLAAEELWNLGREKDAKHKVILPVFKGIGAPLCSPVCDALVVKLPIAFAIVDEEGKVRLANDLAAEALDRPREELEGRDVADVLCPLATLQDAVSREEQTVSLPLPGGRGVADCSVSRLDSRTPSFAVVFREVDRHRSMTAAVPSVVHNLKNSLAAVTMGLELLEQRTDADGDRDEIQLLLNEALKVVKTLNRLGRMATDPPRALPAELAARTCREVEQEG